MVGTTASDFMREVKRSTSSSIIFSARSASFLRSEARGRERGRPRGEDYRARGRPLYLALGLFLALGSVVGRHRLQIVHIVNEHPVQLVYVGVDIARHGNINEEHGAIAPAFKQALTMLAAEERLGRAG